MKTEEKDYRLPDESYDTTVTERLYHYIVEIRHMKRNPFYELTGVSNGTLDRKGGMTTDSIQKVLLVEQFENLNLNWLIMGKGQPEIQPQVNHKTKEFEELKEKMTMRLEELNDVRKKLEDCRLEVDYLKKKKE